MNRVVRVIEVIREARVSASADQVWAIVSDPGRAHDWFDFSDRTEVLAGDGVGQKRTQHGHWGRRKSEVDQEIIAWEPAKLLAWKHLAERLDGKPAPKFAASTEFRIELDGDGDTTLVRLRSLQEPASAVKGWLMKRLGTKDIERSLDRSLERLAELT
jgi:uncharacterized protein YndB with AHSA1/START domain